jgi:hypothetical protein
MKTREISPKAWPKFFGRLAEFHRGTMISIRTVQTDGVSSFVLQNVPLQSVVWDDKSDACNDTILIEAGLPDERPTQHRIVEPIQVLLKNGDDNDRYNHVHILAEEMTTIITLKPGLTPVVLDGLDEVLIGKS